jgi:hypothetical protein
MNSIVWNGVITDPSQAKEVGFYSVIRGAEEGKIIGVPNSEKTKIVMEHNGSEWVEVSEPCTHVPNMVPNDGSYVENLYCNWQIDADKFISEIEKIPEDCWEDDGCESDGYLLFEVGEENNYGYIVRFKASDSDYCNYKLISNGDCYFDCTKESGECRIDGGFEEWSNMIEIKADLNVTHSITGAKIGTANHLLTNLFSTRPFTTTTTE